VVPGQVYIHDSDYEVRYRALQQRRAGAVCKADMRAPSRLSGKVIAQQPLILCEHANAIPPGAREDAVSENSLYGFYTSLGGSPFSEASYSRSEPLALIRLR
jgi:hypothetical protein